MRPNGRRLPLFVRAVPAALLLTAVAGCTAEPVTPQARRIEGLYNAVLLIAVLVFIGINAAIIWSVVRYRKRKDDDGSLPPQTHGNTTAEIVWTVIPTIIVLILFGMSYSTLREVDDEAPQDEVAAIVHVRGFQWFWEFDYGDNKVVKPGRDGKPPVLTVPAGETVRVFLTSDNVLHAFFVPQFLFKRDVTVGQENRFDFRVDIPGRYKGQCAELCGTGHADMTFEVRALVRAEFDEWLAGLKPAGCTGTEQPATPAEVTSPNGVAQFDQTCVVARANQPTTIRYTNGGGLPHNVAISEGLFDISKVRFGLPEAEIINSGTIDYQVPALPAGDYTFFCQVHPGMQGHYLVK